MTRVLMLSTDAKILDQESAVFLRMEKYAEALGHLTVIVFARGTKSGPAFSRGPLFVYCAGGNRVMSYFRGLRAALWFKGDIVSSQDPFEVGFLSWYVAFRLKLPLQIQVHTDLSHEYKRAGIRNRLQVLLARFVLPRASCVRAVSMRSVSNMQHMGIRLKVPPLVLPIYVDLQRYKPGEKKSTIVREQFPQYTYIALWVGRLEYEKDPEAALHAFVEVLHGEPKAGLIYVGDGSHMEELKRLAVSFGIEASVKFVGFTDPLPFYQSADVLLVTSRYEGFGMAMVEAAATGLPVVSYDVGIAKEMGATVVTPALLPQAVLECFRNPKAVSLPESFLMSEEKYFSVYTEALKTCAQK